MHHIHLAVLFVGEETVRFIMMRLALHGLITGGTYILSGAMVKVNQYAWALLGMDYYLALSNRGSLSLSSNCKSVPRRDWLRCIYAFS